MVTTSNYVARKYGVRSAMPGFIAIQLCEDLILIPCNFTKYNAVAKQFRDIISEYDPHFETLGLDEAKLDVTEWLVENDLDNPEGR
jgi:DNA polymerase kappa